MKLPHRFSFQRLRGIIAKEFTQMRRDRLTFAMMLGIPLIQLTLFGFAINSDPRHLPAAVLLADQGPQGRTLLYAMKNSTYFDFVRQVKTEREGHDLLARGQVQFVINIPENFSRDLLRGDRPALLVEADATDPAATGIALGSLEPLFDTALQNDLKGPLASLSATQRPDRSARPCALQPGSCYPIQHRARADGRHLNHDNGDDHWPGYYSRARTRHDGESSLNADTPERSAHWKNSSLHFRRLHPGIASF